MEVLGFHKDCISDFEVWQRRVPSVSRSLITLLSQCHFGVEELMEFLEVRGIFLSSRLGWTVMSG